MNISRRNSTDIPICRDFPEDFFNENYPKPIPLNDFPQNFGNNNDHFIAFTENKKDEPQNIMKELKFIDTCNEKANSTSKISLKSNQKKIAKKFK